MGGWTNNLTNSVIDIDTLGDVTPYAQVLCEVTKLIYNEGMNLVRLKCHFSKCMNLLISA